MFKVSVIIPTYDRPKSLIAAVDSVFNQSVIPHEIIVVNDGSENEAIEALRLRAMETNCLIILNTKGSEGGNVARNIGACYATGDILMFLDDDDTWVKEKIAKQLAVFEANSSIGLVYSNRNVVDSNGKIVRKITGYREGNIYPDIFFNNYIGGTSSVAIRKNIFMSVGMFDEKLPALQDFDLWIRICKITLVGLDRNYSVNYAIAENYSNQVTGSLKKKKIAVNHIIEKYHEYISQLDFFHKRKLFSKLHLSLARSARGQDYKTCFKYSLKSFFCYPNFRSLFFIIGF